MFHTVTTLSSSTVISPGTISGRASRKKIRNSPAPSSRAASMSSRGTDTSTNTFIRYTPTGLTMLGRTIPQIELIRPTLA